MSMDKMRTIISAVGVAPGRLRLGWSDGVDVTLDVSALVTVDDDFGGASVGEWGHSVVWPSGADIGAERLWLETLSASGHEDARHFLEWRMRHGLSLTKAAEALGLARRTVAYYSNGDRPVPKAILLACRGWEANEGLPRAA